MKSIIIIIDYFSEKWPEWFPLFLESVRHNPTINWLFHTDCDCETYKPDNAAFRYISREDYIRFVNEKLGIRMIPYDNYKFCDIRPMYGILYEEEIREFDFFGYGDLDVIYGDIRKFYTDDVLDNNIISTHTWCLSGHFALIRNELWLKNAFRRVKNWKYFLEMGHNQRFDEDKFIRIFRYPMCLPGNLKAFYDFLNPGTQKYREKLYLVEQFTTPLTPAKWIGHRKEHPIVWYWKNGRLTNELDGDREFIYLHFMNFKHARYMDPAYGKTAFWNGLPQIVHLTPEEMKQGMQIDRYGFHRINDPW